EVLDANRLVVGEDVFFAATGVTDGDLLQGVRYLDDGHATTESLVMRSRSGTVRTVQARHDRPKLREITGGRYGYLALGRDLHRPGVVKLVAELVDHAPGQHREAHQVEPHQRDQDEADRATNVADARDGREEEGVDRVRHAGGERHEERPRPHAAPWHVPLGHEVVDDAED